MKSFWELDRVKMRLREAKWASKDCQNDTAHLQDGHLKNKVPVPEHSWALPGLC